MGVMSMPEVIIKSTINMSTMPDLGGFIEEMRKLGARVSVDREIIVIDFRQTKEQEEVRDERQR